MISYIVLLISIINVSFAYCLNIQDTLSLEQRNTQLNKALEGTEYYNLTPSEKNEPFAIAAQLSTIPHEWGHFDCYSFQSPMTIQMDYFIIEELLNSSPLALKNDIKNLAYTTVNEMPHDHYLYRNTINHLLLTGPSGLGKTSLALAIACQTGRDFLLMPPGSLSKEFKHSPLSILNNLFYTAITTKKPLIIIFDEVPALTNDTCADFDPILVEQFCSKLDECRNNPNLLIIVIAKDANNLPSRIKERFGHSLYSMPSISFQRRNEILKHYLQDQCKMDPKLLKKLVEQTEGFNLRELNLFVKKAQNNLFSRTLEKGYKTQERIHVNEISAALELIKQSKNLMAQKRNSKSQLYEMAKPLGLTLIAFLAGLYTHSQIQH